MKSRQNKKNERILAKLNDLSKTTTKVIRTSEEMAKGLEILLAELHRQQEKRRLWKQSTELANEIFQLQSARRPANRTKISTRQQAVIFCQKQWDKLNRQTSEEMLQAYRKWKRENGRKA